MSEQSKDSLSTTPVEAGQTWKRIRDGSRIRVVSFDAEWEDVTYRRVYPSGEQSRKQSIFWSNMRAKYELDTDS